MTLTVKPLHLIVTSIVLLGILALVVVTYLDARDGRAQMDATLKLMGEQNQKLRQDAQQWEREKQDIKAQSEADLRDLERAKHELRTAADALKVIRQAVPTIVGTVPTNVNTPDAPSASLPAGGVVLNEQEQKDLAGYIYDCKKCDVERQALKARADLDAALLENAKQRAANLEKERDAAVKAAKGGTWMQRVKKQGKVIGCAGGGAALGGTQGPKEAAVGAVAGAFICAIF